MRGSDERGDLAQLPDGGFDDRCDLVVAVRDVDGKRRFRRFQVAGQYGGEPCSGVAETGLGGAGASKREATHDRNATARAFPPWAQFVPCTRANAAE